MRYTEDDVTRQLVGWIENEADLNDLACMYSEHRPGEVVVVVRGPSGPMSEPHMNGSIHTKEGRSE